MPMSFTSRNGGTPLEVTLRMTSALKSPTVGDCLYAAERQRARIVTRSGRGVDVDGRAFTAYKDAYRKRKEKSGRDSGIVDLNYTGKMLQGLVSRAGGREISGRSQEPGLTDNPQPVSFFTIGVYGEEAKRAAAINAGGGHQPVRRFIGASSDDRRLMVRDITARMQARANGKSLNAT